MLSNDQLKCVCPHFAYWL